MDRSDSRHHEVASPRREPRGGGHRTHEGRSRRDQVRRLDDHDPGCAVSRSHRAAERALKAWSREELRRIAEADDLHVSPFREHGLTYGTPTWIWSVAVDDALYVRAYNGHNSRWYQAAGRQKAGRITAAGMTKEVTFEPVDGPINDR